MLEIISNAMDRYSSTMNFINMRQTDAEESDKVPHNTRAQYTKKGRTID